MLHPTYLTLLQYLLGTDEIMKIGWFFTPFPFKTIFVILASVPFMVFALSDHKLTPKNLLVCS